MTDSDTRGAGRPTGTTSAAASPGASRWLLVAAGLLLLLTPLAIIARASP